MRNRDLNCIPHELDLLHLIRFLIPLEDCTRSPLPESCRAVRVRTLLGPGELQAEDFRFWAMAQPGL